MRMYSTYFKERQFPITNPPVQRGQVVHLLVKGEKLLHLLNMRWDAISPLMRKLQ